jgi:hypothetical protein
VLPVSTKKLREVRAQVGPASRSLGIVFTLVYVGVTVLRPALPQNLAFVDIPILALILLGIFSMSRRGSLGTRIARDCAPWIWVILLGSVVGLIGVGFPLWALSSLARSLSALLAFFVFTHLFLTREGLTRYALIGTWIGFVLTVSILIVTSGVWRPDALFQHPNYPAHYCVAAAAVLLFNTEVRWQRVVIVVGTAAALFQTASFGGIAMALTMLAVVTARKVGSRGAVLLLIVLCTGVLALLVTGVQPELGNTDVSVSESISEGRFERSRETRAEIWGKSFDQFTKSPGGVGPDGVRNRQIAAREVSGVVRTPEIHADALGYLVERGILGVIGLVGLWITIWRRTAPGGLAHLMIVGILVAGLFRETMHYRHLWLLLALSVALDRLGTPGPLLRPRRDTTSPDDGTLVA